MHGTWASKERRIVSDGRGSSPHTLHGGWYFKGREGRGGGRPRGCSHRVPLTRVAVPGLGRVAVGPPRLPLPHVAAGAGSEQGLHDTVPCWEVRHEHACCSRAGVGVGVRVGVRWEHG